MNCVEGCNRSNYHYNPLVSPLLNFHGTIVKLGSQLPEEGKAAEVAKRIGFIVVSPFAYIALAFVCLAGLILNEIWEMRHALQIKAGDFKGEGSEKKITQEVENQNSKGSTSKIILQDVPEASLKDGFCWTDLINFEVVTSSIGTWNQFSKTFDNVKCEKPSLSNLKVIPSVI